VMKIKKLSKKYIAFFTVVPVLLGVSLISLPCPICNGTGEVCVVPGMEEIHIMRVSGTQVTTVMNVCEMYTLFQYEMTVKVTNTSNRR